MAKKKGRITIAVFKGNRDVEANALKANAICVVMKFVARVRSDVDVMEDDKCIIMTMPDERGDMGWMGGKVFRFVDVLGTSTPAQTEARAQKAYELYQKQEDASPDKVGYSIVEWYLNEYYMLQKSASIFRRD